MKKILFFCLLTISFLITATTIAQDKTTVSLTAGATYVNVPCTAADTLKSTDTIWTLTKSNKDWPATQDVLVKLTKISGSPRVAFSFWGRKFTTSAWVQIGSTVTWYATTTDTTALISNATDNRYREYKMRLTTTATAQKSRLDKLEIKEYFGAP